MGKVLRDLWILHEHGLAVFSRVIDPSIEPQMFGGLMTALNKFAETLSQGGISNFELSSIRFTIEKRNHFVFVTNSSSRVKPKKIINELKKISKKFFEIYPEEIIEKWDNNINIFENFEEKIIDSLVESA
ncbi:MAG: hypothetical protein ACFFCE_19525 [Promethearchaeota archaeon]